MPNPSFYTQLDAFPISSKKLFNSPRHWNCGLMRYAGKIWLSYRFHRMQNAGRCGTAICQLNPNTLQPTGISHFLKLGALDATDHHEDARLFLFRGEPYVSYTEMQGYRPGVDYTCTIKYAKLRLKAGRWEVVGKWHPKFGMNDGKAKEKNWVFFECNGKLHAVYSPGRTHQVIQLEGDRVVKLYESEGPAWHFGSVRGGTPPVRQLDGTFISIFHSSLPTEKAPHFVRYYGGAYTFQGEPPFASLRISTRPLMRGSEEDGHQVDPRYVAGWKPFVVFPCGLIEDANQGWMVSAGVNDWQCAIAKLKADELFLGAANGSDIPPRYFRCANGSLPLSIFAEAGRRRLVEWIMLKPKGGMVSEGFMVSSNARESEEIANGKAVEEIGYSDFEEIMAQKRREM